VPVVQRGPGTGLVALLALLCTLTAGAGLGRSGWLVGISCGALLSVALSRSLARRAGFDGLGAANWVTLARATFACGAAALTADSWVSPPARTTLLILATLALVLDWVDGQVARRTGTASRFGAQFDMEVDAFLILVLSVYVAASVGVWVLAIGTARYALLAATWLLPWLRQPAPSRRWCKVVAAAQGIVLVIASADVLPPVVTEFALAAALILLAESFGRQVWWLRAHRFSSSDGVRVPSRLPSPSTTREVGGVAV
jgi:phosphatidylglycerophosphate synthase